MTTVERRLLARIASRGLTILAGLCWLAVAIQLPRIAGLFMLFDNDRVVAIGLRLAVCLEVALIFAAPLGAILVLFEAKSSGLLTTLFGAGLRMPHVRRVLLLAALATAALSSAAAGLTTVVRASWLARKESRGLSVVRAGSTYLWPFDRADGRALLFRADSLDVSLAESARWVSGEGAFILSPSRPLSGEPIDAGREVRPEAPPLDAFLPPPSPSWPVRAALVALNRVTLAAILLLLGSYVALILPIEGQRSAFLHFLLVPPVVATGAFWCSTLLWAREREGLVAEAVWLAALIGALVALDRTFARRGLRTE
jgi:hypothetical protein